MFFSARDWMNKSILKLVLILSKKEINHRVENGAKNTSRQFTLAFPTSDIYFPVKKTQVVTT